MDIKYQIKDGETIDKSHPKVEKISISLYDRKLHYVTQLKRIGDTFYIQMKIPRNTQRFRIIELK